MPRPATIECALFDCDGVIVDSEPLSARRNLRALHALGVPATYEDCLAMSGLSSEQKVPALLKRYESNRTLEEFRAACRAQGEPYLNPDLRVFDGLHEVLENLQALGACVGLVSTTVGKRISVLLERFDLADLFDVVVTGDMVARHKPDPEPYLRAMELLDVCSERTIVLEDSAVGITSAKAAGAYVFGVCASSVSQDVSAADELLESYVGIDLLAGRRAEGSS